MNITMCKEVMPLEIEITRCLSWKEHEKQQQ